MQQLPKIFVCHFEFRVIFLFPIKVLCVMVLNEFSQNKILFLANIPQVSKFEVYLQQLLFKE